MKILNRAKHLYSDEYIISESVKFIFNQMYLLVNNQWAECDESTRSINLSDMIDSEGTKIFASLSEDGRGGDILEFPHHKETTIFSIAGIKLGLLDFTSIKSISKFYKVTGIQE